ncbi:MAG: DNA polymerase III subunit epsilon [Xanthomonadales bacterium]|nr:DNA polymerase III subunit epsilon [Xanthomonadales bacterium]
MRQIVLDTETTGLEVSDGNRLIEIGAVELLERRITGKQFHYYLNPQRSIEEGALEVHGITEDFLQDKPLFAEVSAEFLEFIQDAELVIHNAAFDLGFLDAELAMLADPAGRVSDFASVLDTLELAREMHPGQRNSLDALCKRYEIDNSSRNLHGALLDAQILAEVYLAMTGGQTDLGLSFGVSQSRTEISTDIDAGNRPPLRVLYPRLDELELHQNRLQAIRKASGSCLWLEMNENGISQL